MANSAMMGGRAALLAVAVAAGIGSYVIWQRGQAPDVSDTASGTSEIVAELPAVAVVTAEPVAVEPIAVAPEAVELTALETAAEPAPTTVPVVDEPAPPMTPTFDVVRIEADGTALIAGMAPADARVSLRLDGVEEVRVQSGGDGAFVAQFTMPPNPAPRLLSMVAMLADGTEIAADETVAVAPIAAIVPDAVAAEPAPPAAILLTDEGAEVVQGAVPVAAGEAAAVTLDAIAYAPDGAVQLSGRGQGDAALRIYLDNAPVIEAAIGADGKWAVTLPDTVPGIYTLRIDQMTSDGSVGARFETPFKRETLEALAAANGAPEGVEATPDVTQSAPVAEIEAAPETAIAIAPAPQPDLAVPTDIASLPALAADPVTDAPVSEPETAAVAAVEPAAPAPEPASVQPVVAEPAKAPVTVTVQPGFTLWGIATEQFGEGTMYVQVFEANRSSIKDPDLIYPGQVFTLPQE